MEMIILMQQLYCAGDQLIQLPIKGCNEDNGADVTYSNAGVGAHLGIRGAEVPSRDCESSHLGPELTCLTLTKMFHTA